MWLRRAFFHWLVPAAFVLPVWLLIGWGVFRAGGWAFLWVIFLAIPGVFLWQMLLTLLIRARGTVRAHRAVSWWDVGGLTVWHLLVISLGFFVQEWWAPMLFVTIAVGIALFWVSLSQLLREAQPSRVVLRSSGGVSYMPPEATPDAGAHGETPEVIVLRESKGPSA